jgi:molybdopterin-containing oxidoreductase family iron-sulfur binding subunit
MNEKASEKLLQIGLPRPSSWRSLGELTGRVQRSLDEFPNPGTPSEWSRRMFLKMIGASAAMAGIAGCGRDLPEKILPFSLQPHDVTPGEARTYATALELDGYATPLLVRVNDGRPTKIEGHPDHPDSQGATTPFQQAAVLGLYDPDRAARVLRDGEPSSWDALLELLAKPRDDRGAQLRILLPPTASPTVARLCALARARHPGLGITVWSPVPVEENAMAGARLAFGEKLAPRYHLDEAEAILSLDADLFGAVPGALRHMREWSARRDPKQAMNRLYVVESMPTTTGFAADHRIRMRSSEIAAATAIVVDQVGRLPSAIAHAIADRGARDRRLSAALADLATRAPGRSLVVVGERQPPALHALGYALNSALGNLGRTLRFTPPPVLEGDRDLATLIGEMHAGAVETLIILDGNPVYGAPVDLGFATALARVPRSIYLARYEDETARACQHVAPLADPLECWGDGRATDGSVTLAQPLILPLHEGRSAIELLGAVCGDRAPSGYRLVRATHTGRSDWEGALRRGFFPDGAATETVPRALDVPAIHTALRAIPPAEGGLELGFYPSPTVHDGRFTNNAWLMELPQPITKLTWENAICVSPTTASRLHLEDERWVELLSDGRRLRGPILIVPGHADDAISIHLGFGRTGGESIAAGHGFSAARLRTSRATWCAPQARIVPLDGRASFARTQEHFHMHGGAIAVATTLDEYRNDREFLAEERAPQPSLMSPRAGEKIQWGMAIDLGRCTGCNACTVACQSENNVPVVGKEEVARGHEMHWIRIDTYFRGAPEAPRAVNQPMMCQHCETAPCEYVCPVNATVHSPDGLNEMVYNRCVGTRFCSNNCPYKVRRFNWFNWNKRGANVGSVQLGHNPEVTVRDRGVMEKCSYCVQRIRTSEIAARNDGRPLRPGEVMTACQQACPTKAIVFDSLAFDGTELANRRAEPRSYSVLNGEGTRPRTEYLARIDNPNREIE